MGWVGVCSKAQGVAGQLEHQAPALSEYNATDSWELRRDGHEGMM